MKKKKKRNLKWVNKNYFKDTNIERELYGKLFPTYIQSTTKYPNKKIRKMP